MTDRVEFLYVRKEFTETLSEKWAMYLTQREESQASSSGSCNDEPQAICGRVERPKQCEISDSLGVISASNARRVDVALVT